MDAKTVYEVLQPLGLKPLNKAWAKIEIFLGLFGVFLGLIFVIAPLNDIRSFGTSPGQPAWASFLMGTVLFVGGGFLAMAGHRSHLYQSNNQLIAFVIEEIRKSAKKESKA